MSRLATLSRAPFRATPVGSTPAGGTGAYHDLVAATNPIAWWPLNASLSDEIGSLDLSVAGGIESYADPLTGEGKSFNCNGENHLSRAHDASLALAVGTIMVWWRATTVHTGHVISKDAPSGGAVDDDFSYRTFNDGTCGPYFQSSGETWLEQGRSRTLNPVYGPGDVMCCITTFNADGFAHYLNGNLIGIDDRHTTGLQNNTDPLTIGQAFGIIFDGRVQHPAIWDRILTTNTIFSLANLGVPS